MCVGLWSWPWPVVEVGHRIGGRHLVLHVARFLGRAEHKDTVSHTPVIIRVFDSSKLASDLKIDRELITDPSL